MIWKTSLEVQSVSQRLELPAGAVVRAVRMNPPAYCIEMWFEFVDGAENVLEPRTFRIHGTGHPAGTDATYVGTAFDDANGFVWHVYEVLS